MRHHRYTNITGWAQVVGSESGGYFESALERDRFMWFVPQPDVQRVRLHPHETKYVAVDGQVRKYRPDLQVDFKLSTGRRPLVVEVKYTDHITDDPADTDIEREEKAYLRAKHALLAKHYQARGCDFAILTEEEVYTSEGDARRFVFEHVNEPYHPCEVKILGLMDRLRKCSMHELLLGVQPDDLIERLQTVGSVWKLVARHFLRADFNQHLGYDAVIECS